MNTFFSSVLCITAVTAAVGIILPKNCKTEKYVRFIIALLTVMTLIKPFTKSFSEVPEFKGYTEYETDEQTHDIREMIVLNTSEIIKKNIENELFSRFRISKDHADVSVSLNSDDYENVYPEKISITLKSYGAWGNKTAIEDYFSEKYSASTEVLYE